MKHRSPYHRMDLTTLFTIGIALTVIGIIIAVIAMLLLSVTQSEERTKVKGGGVILIGPFPIIFGTDKQSLKIVIILAIVLIIVALITVTVFYSILR